jgi:hypothetical protein
MSYILIVVVVLASVDVKAVQRTPFPTREECDHAVWAGNFPGTITPPAASGIAIAAFCAPALSP